MSKLCQYPSRIGSIGLPFALMLTSRGDRSGLMSSFGLYTPSRNAGWATLSTPLAVPYGPTLTPSWPLQSRARACEGSVPTRTSFGSRADSAVSSPRSTNRLGEKALGGNLGAGGVDLPQPTSTTASRSHHRTL